MGLVKKSIYPVAEPLNPLLVYISSWGVSIKAIRNGRLDIPNISIKTPRMQLTNVTARPKKLMVAIYPPVRASITMILYR